MGNERGIRRRSRLQARMGGREVGGFIDNLLDSLKQENLMKNKFGGE